MQIEAEFPDQSPARGSANSVDQRIGVLETQRVWVKLGEVENFPVVHAHVKRLVHGKHQRIPFDFLDSIQREVKSMVDMCACDGSVAKETPVNREPAHTIILN